MCAPVQLHLLQEAPITGSQASLGDSDEIPGLLIIFPLNLVVGGSVLMVFCGINQLYSIRSIQPFLPSPL